ncbi:MAG: hypothetical protein M4579_004614 [Chaenotheca gracillima]|nr:MAG: hypothetical protein M4579_004614 [Chaenotheca gracillima]
MEEWSDRPAYNIIQIPQTHSMEDPNLLSELTSRYKGFRLQSLQLAPEAFASTYERESQFPVETWNNRLLNPQANTFVAKLTDRGVCDGWLATITMLGPMSGQQGAISANTSPWTSLASEEHGQRAAERRDSIWNFHLNALFTVPSARGNGLGYDLIWHAIAHAKANATEHKVAHVKIGVIVDSSNVAASALYRKCGFAVIEESMLSIPSDPEAGVERSARELKVLTMEQEIQL